MRSKDQRVCEPYVTVLVNKGWAPECIFQMKDEEAGRVGHKGKIDTTPLAAQSFKLHSQQDGQSSPDTNPSTGTTRGRRMAARSADGQSEGDLRKLGVHLEFTG